MAGVSLDGDEGRPACRHPAAHVAGPDRRLAAVCRRRLLAAPDADGARPPGNPHPCRCICCARPIRAHSAATQSRAEPERERGSARSAAVESERGSRKRVLSPRPQLRNARPFPTFAPVTPVRAAPDIVAATFQRTLRHIERYQVYPAEARGERLQGLVQLVFAMGRDGRVLDAWVKQSSGSAVLDKAALDTVKRAQPLPRIPNELPDRLNVMIPVAFARS